MKFVLDWIWNGPWWAPLIGAIYASVLLGILVSALVPLVRQGRGK